MRDDSDEPSAQRHRPPYAGSFSGSGPREDRWRTWDDATGMDDEEETPWQRLGNSRSGPIVIGLTLLLAAGTGIWFAWPESDTPPPPAAVPSAPAPATPKQPVFGVDSPPPPPDVRPSPSRTRRGANQDPARPGTVTPPPPPVTRSAPPSSAPPTRKPKPRRSPDGQSGPTEPPPPPSSSKPTSRQSPRPTSRPTTAPPDDDDTQTGPSLPPPPPGS
ncbi:hypothetical protein [Sphaerisporangium rubeum]|uniref:Uncharacterized protein n=1 Tax=Sphaerisporangium rubeum TaxID=321317 RepID=A0A7X0M6A2_9ACTN|nr:hypothetical protein [Sphaerisporangium rubeum]MBB6471784.1 hypothetical protein [Sphaerisporangium rubeum]